MDLPPLDAPLPCEGCAQSLRCKAERLACAEFVVWVLRSDATPRVRKLAKGEREPSPALYSMAFEG